MGEKGKGWEKRLKGAGPSEGGRKKAGAGAGQKDKREKWAESAERKQGEAKQVEAGAGQSEEAGAGQSGEAGERADGETGLSGGWTEGEAGKGAK